MPDLAPAKGLRHPGKKESQFSNKRQSLDEEGKEESIGVTSPLSAATRRLSGLADQ
jgi:hypothetical protein